MISAVAKCAVNLMRACWLFMRRPFREEEAPGRIELLFSVGVHRRLAVFDEIQRVGECRFARSDRRSCQAVRIHAGRFVVRDFPTARSAVRLTMCGTVSLLFMSPLVSRRLIQAGLPMPGDREG
jgi:hypothetical protein